MIALVAIPVIAGIYAARWIGQVYGWGYHVVILAVLAAYTAFMFRVALGRRPKEKPDLSAFQSSSPDAQALGERVAMLHAGVVQLDRKLRVDAFLVPILLFMPTIIALLVLRDAAYVPENRLWSAVGVVLIIPYVLIRYALPRKNA